MWIYSTCGFTDFRRGRVRPSYKLWLNLYFTEKSFFLHNGKVPGANPVPVGARKQGGMNQGILKRNLNR